MKVIEIINAWNAMSGEAQLTLCENCVKRAIKQGRRLKAGYEFDDVVEKAETERRMLAEKRREEKTKQTDDQ